MITVPYEVAKSVVLDRVHPVTAWRNYYNISQDVLAKTIGLTQFEIDKIEQSNQHLKKDLLEKLSQAFGIKTEALNIRHIP